VKGTGKGISAGLGAHLRGNVVAYLALFVALCGSAYAAVSLPLPKGSVGSKQLRKQAVKTRDIGKGAIVGKKVRKDSLTGKQIKESSLGTVPNSSRVGGSQVQQIHYRATTAGTETLFSIAGLTVTATCSPPDDWVTLTASSSVDGSIIGNGLYKENPGSTTQLPGVENVFNAGASQTIQVDDTATTMVFGNGPDASPVVSANFLANYYTGNGTCSVVGTVVSDG
jgi:hypothetical protein